MKIKHFIVILSWLSLLVTFVAGYQVGKLRREPVPEHNAELPKQAEKICTDTMFLPPPTILVEVVSTPPEDIDTAAIIASYFARRVAADTISSEYVQVEIIDTITQNSLLGRQAVWTFYPPKDISHSFSMGTTLGRNHLMTYGELQMDEWAFLGGYDWYNRGVVFGVKYRFKVWRGKRN